MQPPNAGQPWRPPADLSAGVSSIAFHPGEANSLAVGYVDGRLELYDVASGADVTPPFVSPRPGTITRLAFSSDGEWLAVVEPNIIHTINLNDGRERSALQIEGGTVDTLMFSPDGETLITGMLDGSIVLWDLTSGRRLGTLHGHAGPIMALALDPDDQTLASGGLDTAVVLWRIDEEEWARLACHMAGRNLSPDEWKRYFGEVEQTLTCPPATH